MRQLFTAIILICVMASCQKEVSFDTPTSPGGNSNGDLLVRGLQITPSTNDTNNIYLTWDVNKRLISYESRGRANGFLTNISTKIERDANGKILRIVGKAAAPLSTADSIVYVVGYVSGTNRLQYSVATQHGGFLDGVHDSAVYSYNTAGQVIQKVVFNDFLGQYDLQAKEEITYDSRGNVIEIKQYSADPFSTVYTLTATTTNTFDNNKAPVTLGEECLMFLGATNLSKNNLTKMVSNAVASGTNYSTTMSGLQFNSFGRPTRATLSTTSPPPGGSLTTNVTYFYQ